MSFGVGDFLAISKLIKDIVSSLRAASCSEYRELILEIHGLGGILDEIRNLEAATLSQVSALNAIKCVALGCRSFLDEFSLKLSKFERLGREGKLSKSGRANLYKQKVQYGFTMEDEVRKTRVKLAAHVRSLNTQLLTYSISASTIRTRDAEGEAAALTSKLDLVHDQLSVLSVDTAAQTGLVRETQSTMQAFINYVTRDIASQVQTLIEVANGIWKTNLQLVAFLSKFPAATPAPDLRYTWVQAPVKLEDAFGRVLPVPSEYNWGKIRAIISEQFSRGPGATKVATDQYALFLSSNCSQTLSDDEMLLPGMSVTMAMIIGRYERTFTDRCPRPGCKSTEFYKHPAGGAECTQCRCWFHFDNSKRPQFGPLATTELILPENLDTDEAAKRLSCYTSAAARSTRADRMTFKNVRIFLGADFGLPPMIGATPSPGDVTDPLQLKASDACLPRPFWRLECEVPAPEMVTFLQLLESLKRKPGAIRRIIDIIAEELGCEAYFVMKQLGHPDFLQNLGIDSLYALCISQQIGEELDIGDKQRDLLMLEFLRSSSRLGQLLAAGIDFTA